MTSFEFSESKVLSESTANLRLISEEAKKHKISNSITDYIIKTKTLAHYIDNMFSFIWLLTLFLVALFFSSDISSLIIAIPLSLFILTIVFPSLRMLIKESNTKTLLYIIFSRYSIYYSRLYQAFKSSENHPSTSYKAES